MSESGDSPVWELRVAVTTGDFEGLLTFYRDILGLEPAADWSDDTGRGLMWDMGRGTLELFDEGYAARVDETEVGRRVSGPIRFALRVPDLDAALARAREKGARIVHDPVTTPWGDRNARLEDPDGRQVTLYETGEA